MIAFTGFLYHKIPVSSNCYITSSMCFSRWKACKLILSVRTGGGMGLLVCVPTDSIYLFLSVGEFHMKVVLLTVAKDHRYRV